VIVAGPDGRAVFDLLRRGPQTKPQALLCAFDLLLLANEDLRAHPLERRRQHLTQLLDAAGPGLVLNAQFAEADGAAVFAQACALGLEGIVSKRKGSRYRSGRSLDWRKSKNPVSEAVRRETEEDWSREGRQGGGRNASRSRR
jgi:bifunctional non-homologous end joining protein LigD